MSSVFYLRQLDDECVSKIGFNISSNSTKPLHVANNLFREVCQTKGDIKDIHEWIIGESRTKRRKILSSEELLKKHPELFFEEEDSIAADLREVRFMLESIFNPDGTVYPGYQQSVLNISSHLLVRDKVLPEANIGTFIYKILAYGLDNKQSKIIELIRSSLKNTTDDITKIIVPIVSNRKKVSIETIESSEPNDKIDILQKNIRIAFDNLAENLILTGQSKNSLLVLKRVTNLAIFSSLYYLINIKNIVTEKEQGVVPILFDSGGGYLSIEKASEESYINAKKSIEDFYVMYIKQLLQQEVKNEYDSCIEMMDKKSFENDNHRDVIKQYFDSFSEDEDNDSISALSKSLQVVLYTYLYKNNTPSDFCRVLGVRCGLVGPRGNAAKKKFLINRFLLETLTLSCIDSNLLKAGIELKELGDALFDLFSIIIGTNTERDYDVLDRDNISKNAPGDLRGELSANAQIIGDILVSLKLASKYADGVTIIKWG